MRDHFTIQSLENKIQIRRWNIFLKTSNRNAKRSNNFI